MAKILVVDDVEDNRKLLQYDLEDDGYEVFFACDGVECLEQAEAIRPDVILLDIMMPRMDGIEACKKLKENPELSNIPVLMLSAKDQDEDVIRGLDAGAADYIAKPINYPIVAARVRSSVRAKELNEQLVAEKERAEMALRAKSSFFAAMSHEIRTPITAIMGLADIIHSDDVDSPFDRHQAARMVLSNSRYLLEVINNILDLSKAESGKLDVERIPCSIFEVMRDVNSIVELKALEKDLFYRVDFEYPLPKTIQVDPTRLKQVIINLISNALKFTEDGSVKVKVCYLPESREIDVAVTDTGIGMSEEEVSRLFEPFQQANETITRRFGGTGLGLNISKTIIQKLGGEISVQSEQGVGSTFRFQVPIGDCDTLALTHNNPLLASLEATDEAFALFGTVLLVEDEPVNQKLISHVLSKIGLQVETAGCGKSGLNKALSRTYDLILMDMHLPEVDGLTVIKELKSKNVQVPIVALTASQDRAEIEELLHAGCEEYVPKPFERAQLYECLRRYFVGEEHERSAQLPPGDAANPYSGDEQYAELVLSYLDKLHMRLSSIQEDFSSQNWDGLREKAHRLAGAGLFGFPRLSLVAKLLEEQAVKKNAKTCKELVKRLQREINGITDDGGIQKKEKPEVEPPLH